MYVADDSATYDTGHAAAAAYAQEDGPSVVQQRSEPFYAPVLHWLSQPSDYDLPWSVSRGRALATAGVLLTLAAGATGLLWEYTVSPSLDRPYENSTTEKHR